MSVIPHFNFILHRKNKTISPNACSKWWWFPPPPPHYFDYLKLNNPLYQLTLFLTAYWLNCSKLDLATDLPIIVIEKMIVIYVPRLSSDCPLKFKMFKLSILNLNSEGPLRAKVSHWKIWAFQYLNSSSESRTKSFGAKGLIFKNQDLCLCPTGNPPKISLSFDLGGEGVFALPSQFKSPISVSLFPSQVESILKACYLNPT